MSDVLVYAAAPRAQTARKVLGEACRATGLGIRLEVYGTGSLYQRLGPRHGPPLPDVVTWFGPFAAHAAGLDSLLQPHQPARVAEGALHDPDWRWTTLDFGVMGIFGATPVGTWLELTSVKKLALADPERSEAGLAILLASLDRARQVESDVERGWAWWLSRAKNGLALAEDEPGAVALAAAASGTSPRATHALSLMDERGTPVPGLAPIPNAVAIAANARNLDGARRLVDWLTGESAANLLRRSPWQAATNGLQALVESAPPLDVEWCRQQYTATRRRWGQFGFTPA